ncbi:sprT domain-containing protein [Bacillus cereus]|uniref:SprT domain-containing protein n=1 Tax=Bacillus cereus TaxID=1396 RepID=A0A9X6UC67_BACCE|nr:SprT-like domain-containing protein [Bacillus cereus]PEN97803.1 sprT domain-containing protein [Bacillus cereus]
MLTRAEWGDIKFKLEMVAIKFLKENYDMRLGIPIVLNGRIKRTFGRFIHAPHNAKNRVSHRIEMSKNYIEHQTWENVISTLKHELIHYALYELGKPYRDGEELFESELAKHGSHSSGTLIFKGELNVYKCKGGCGVEYRRVRKYPNNAERYTCGLCGSGIYYDGKVSV